MPGTFREKSSNVLVFDSTAESSGWSPATVAPTQNGERSPSPVLPSLKLPIPQNGRHKSELEAVIRPVINPDIHYANKGQPSETFGCHESDFGLY